MTKMIRRTFILVTSATMKLIRATVIPMTTLIMILPQHPMSTLTTVTITGLMLTFAETIHLTGLQS